MWRATSAGCGVATLGTMDIPSIPKARMLRTNEAPGLAGMWPADHLEDAPGDRTRLKNMQQLILLRWRTGREATNTELFVAMLVDVATLTAQLYLSGGATNPFASLYLLQVILGAVLLQAWSSATLVVITGLCLVGLALFSRPLALPLDLD